MLIKKIDQFKFKYMLCIPVMLLLHNLQASDCSLKADSYSRELSNQFSNSFPYIYKFSANPKRQLLYLATNHVMEEASPLFNLIQSEFENFRPTAIIFEGGGVPYSLGRSPDKFLKLWENSKRISESIFITRLAKDKNIPFWSAEPDDKYSYQILKNKNFSDYDILGFYFFRYIRSKSIHKNFIDKELENSFNKYIKRKKRSLGLLKLDFSWPQFNNWFLDKNGRKFSLPIRRAEIQPIKNGVLITQRVAAESIQLRDDHILKVINNISNRYSRVFILYGADHFPVQYKVLKCLFGEGIEY